MCRSISLYVETFPGGVGNFLVLGAMIVSIGIGRARRESGLVDHDCRIEELKASDKSLMKDRMAEARDLTCGPACAGSGRRWRGWSGS